MNSANMFCASKRAWNRVLVITLSLLVIIILALSWIWVQRNTLVLLKTNRELLQVYTNNLQSIVFTPIERASINVQQLLRLSDEEQGRVDIGKELSNLRYTSAALERVWIMNSEGNAVYPVNVNKALTERSSWWKRYLEPEKVALLERLGKQGFGPYEYEVAPAFRDDMDLSTILPVVLWHQAKNGSIIFAFLEFNLTTLLGQEINSYQVIIGDNETEVEVIIFDKNGLALETSRNFPRQVEAMPSNLEDSKVLHFIDLSNGAVFTRQDSFLSLYSRNSTLGLTFTTRIPWEEIVGQSRKNYIFIFLLAALFSLVFLVLMIVYVRLHANVRRYEAMQAESRFEALQARMNPHFLFNTLDSLVSVVEEGDRRRSLDTLRSLSYILHFDLREQRNEIPLFAELRYIRNYVNLQKIRYQGQFVFSLEVHDSVPDDIRILKYCIQPLVENCFVHGVYLRQEPIAIDVALCFYEQGLCIRVSDDGPGCEQAVYDNLLQKITQTQQGIDEKNFCFRGKHIGLLNIHQRIFYAYGESFGLKLLRKERGFCVEVLLPAVYQRETEKSSSEFL